MYTKGGGGAVGYWSIKKPEVEKSCVRLPLMEFILCLVIAGRRSIVSTTVYKLIICNGGWRRNKYSILVYSMMKRADVFFYMGR